MKVLFVDDSPMVIHWMTHMIPQELKPRLEVFTANDGEAGWEIFQRELPAMVFLDLTMPKLDGFALLERIKACKHETSVIIVTADPQQSTKNRLLMAGAQMILNKPILGTQKEIYISLLQEKLEGQTPS